MDDPKDKNQPTRAELLTMSILFFGGIASVLVGVAYLSYQRLAWYELCMVWGGISIGLSLLFVAVQSQETPK